MTPSIWIAVGDIHNDIGKFHTIPELNDAEGIIITGDITFAQGVHQASQTMAPFIDTGKKILAQPGNMDHPEVTDWLTREGWNIHCTVKMLPHAIPCFGVGFSPVTPFNTPGEFPEEQFSDWLAQGMLNHPELATAPTWIFVSHTPPFDTRCDRLANGTAVGSRAVRRFIEQYQPTYCLCGHIHESAASDTIGNTTVINPGTLADGGYIVLTFTGDPDRPVKAERKVCP